MPIFRQLALASLLAAPSAAPANPAPDAPADEPLVCLAKTIYFEARGQSDEELLAVAHVVRNRVEHPDFPRTMCGVVKEGGEEPPCQFAWWCDGRPDVARDDQEYLRALDTARRVLSGESEDPTDGANMFHNTSVKPAWTRAARGRGQIGDHLFYHLEER